MGNYDPVTFAQRGVSEFDAILAEQRAAMDCHHCEEFLQRGIAAYRWLERAEETVVQAETDCLLPFSPEAHAALDNLYRLLLRRFDEAESHARQVVADGFTPDNLAEFRECHARLSSWLMTQAAIEAATLPHESLTQYARHLAE
jgi:hypothetical protein